MKTPILLLLLFIFLVVDLVLRSKFAQAIKPFELVYNVIYTALVAVYCIYLVYQCAAGQTAGRMLLAVCSIVVLAATVFLTWKNWMQERKQ